MKLPNPACCRTDVGPSPSSPIPAERQYRSRLQFNINIVLQKNEAETEEF